jgi:hypothetical protein
VEKAARDLSVGERRSLAARGEAMADGSFPIRNRDDLEKAIHLAGNAKDPAAARRFIRKRAKALGAEDAIPETWKD